MNDTDSIMDLYDWINVIAIGATLLFMLGVGIYHHLQFKKDIAELQRKVGEANAKWIRPKQS